MNAAAEVIRSCYNSVAEARHSLAQEGECRSFEVVGFHSPEVRDYCILVV